MGTANLATSENGQKINTEHFDEAFIELCHKHGVKCAMAVAFTSGYRQTVRIGDEMLSLEMTTRAVAEMAKERGDLSGKINNAPLRHTSVNCSS